MGNATEFKGRAKEAAGTITDNEELEREGKVDQAGGKIKRKLDEAVDKAKGALHRVER